MSDWQQIEEGLDGQTVAFFQDQTSGDEIEVRDTYTNPVQLLDVRDNRYKVIYDRHSGLPDLDLSDTFGRPQDALRYTVEGLIGEDLDTYDLPDYNFE